MMAITCTLALLASTVADTAPRDALAGFILDDECKDESVPGDGPKCTLSALQLTAQKSGTNTTQAKIYGHPSSAVNYPVYPGFTLMLAEEFDTPLDLDSDPVWTWSDGGLEEGQIRFVKEAIQFQDGKMKIVVDRNHRHQHSCSHAEKGHIHGNAKVLTAGELRSRHNMFRYGRYEVRMKTPSVQPGNAEINGNYVSTMFVFRDPKTSQWREIDFEVTGDSPGSITANVLNANHQRKWSPNIASPKDVSRPINTRADFHTYAFEWLPDKITWYLDGKVVRTYTGHPLPVPKESAKVMMNLWIYDHRGLFGGKHVENNRYPMHSEYDYFRFYKWDGEAKYPCTGMGEHCLSHEDKYRSGNNPCDGISQPGTCSAPC